MTRAEIRAALESELGSAAEARWIVEEVLGPAPHPAGDDRSPVPTREQRAILALADRRLAGVPLQYALGHWAFRTLDLAVDPRVLIPRPETEQVAGLALRELERLAGEHPAVVVDLGTGSGAVALAIASEGRPGAAGLSVWATDADPEALAVAAQNRERVRTENPTAAERVTLRRGDWWRALPEELRERIDVVVANPPYVAEAEWADLPAVVRLEPYRALVAAAGSDGTPGLADVEVVLAGAPRWLRRPGAVVVEVAPHQAPAAAELARRAGLSEVRVVPDLSGRDRAVVGRR